MSAICIIPARAGSKRIPYKNARLFHGQPIISYSIDVAKRSKLFERIIVSTDDQNIAKISIECGAEVPFLRPATLADDYTGTVPVIRHALEALTQQLAGVNAVCCIYPTAPLLDELSLVKGYEKLCDEHVDYCYPVTRFSHPVERALTMDEKGRLTAISPPNFSGRTQDMVSAYHDAGQFYWGTVRAFVSGLKIVSARAVGIPIPRFMAQDIDTEEDWRTSELMFTALRSIKA